MGTILTTLLLWRSYIPGAEDDTAPSAQNPQARHDQVLSEPYDSSNEEREDAEIAVCYFPTLFDPATRSQSGPNGFYEDINFYPGQRSVQRCKACWIKELPNIYTVASASQGVEAGKEEQ